MQVCGVDDAGRGSLLGPLVIAGVLISRSKIGRLSRMGVRDSKRLSPSKREHLYGMITEAADGYCISRIGPGTIDRSVRRHLLNRLEARYMARVISRLGPGVSYVDSCDVNPARFGREVSMLSNNSRVRSYHHADDRFAVVSAASIIAKVSRDKEIAKLRKKYDVGSGYPSDPRTINFVRRYISENSEAPVFARASWLPVRRMMQEA